MNESRPHVGAVDRSQHEILVVDDNPASRYATARLLRSVGFRTREAGSSGEALRLADQGLSAMVLDVHLPDMDGFETCRILRTREDLARLPVLHLSAAYVTDDDKVRGLDAGADAYLTHPVEPAVIVATVQALVRTRMAENAMRASEAKFRVIYADAPTGIGLVDEQGRFIEANPALLALLGRSLEGVIGRTVREFAPPGAEAGLDGLAGSPQAAWRGELTLQRGDGTPTHLEWRVTPLTGTPNRLVTAADIAERLRIEQARADLLEREQAARSEAERVSRLKDDLIAVLSHELRSPLNAIMGWTHVLQRRETSEEAKKGLQAIERNGRAQARLLADILDASRINMGKLRLELQPADPVELLESALDALKPSLEGNDNPLEIEIERPLPVVLVDAARFQQIVWNLLSNAVKFSPRGAPIRVALRAHADGVRLTVADRGRGIAPEFLPFLFDRFSQGDVRANRYHGGLGLGLSIVKQLAHMHGGAASAYSAGEGHGALFTIDLPAATTEALRGEDAPAPQSVYGDLPRGAGEGRLQGLSVLIVDDDAEAGATLDMILGDHGASVVTARGHDEALQLLQGLVPDVLISDLGMPGKNGFDLLREVRAAEPPGHRIAAIALTAFTRDKDVEQALAAGFDAHCAKPLKPLELIELIVGLTRRG